MTKIQYQYAKLLNGYVEYTQGLPIGFVLPMEAIKTENTTYTRISGNKAVYRVIAYVYRENSKAISIDMFCEVI